MIGMKVKANWGAPMRGMLSVPEVAVVVEDESARHRLDDHLGRVDPQKDVPAVRSDKE